MILNKIIKLIFVIVLLISVDVFGQRSKFELGLEVGFNLSMIKANDLKHYPLETINFTGGIAIQYNLLAGIACQLNVKGEK